MKILRFINSLITLCNFLDEINLICHVATTSPTIILLDLIQVFRDLKKNFCIISIIMENFVLCNKELMIQLKKRETFKRLKFIHDLFIWKYNTFKCKYYREETVSLATIINRRGRECV